MNAPRDTETPPAAGVFEVYPSIRPPGMYRWRLVDHARDVTLTSGAAFAKAEDATEDAERVRAAATAAAVVMLSSPHPREAGATTR